MWKKIKPYLFFVALCLLVGFGSSFFIGSNTDIYETLNRPPLSPPSWLFPVAWSIIYVLMGIGAGRVQSLNGSLPPVFYAQLFVNFFWSILFFNLEAFGLSFLWLLLLWVLIIIMIKEFYKTCKAVAFIQLPYLLWVTFAGYLNLMIYLLN